MFLTLSTPTWRANLLTPNHSSDGSSHGIPARQNTGQESGPGFPPAEGHSDAQVRLCLEEGRATDERRWSNGQRDQSLTSDGGLVTLL